MHLPALDRDVARPPGGDRAGVAGDDGVVAQPLAELAGDDLRLHRRVRAACRAPPSAAAIACMPSCACSRKRAVLLALQQRQQRAQRAPRCRRPARPRPDSAGRCAPGRGRSARRAPGPASGRTRCRGSERADDQQRVALLHRLLRRLACPAGRCRRSCTGCRPAPPPCRAAP